MEDLIGQMKLECENIIRAETEMDSNPDGCKRTARKSVWKIGSILSEIVQRYRDKIQMDGVFMPGELNYVKKDEIENPIAE